MMIATLPGSARLSVPYGDDPIPELKRQLAAAIVREIDGYPAWEVAELMGTDQPRVSDLRKGKLERFSLESLIRFLTRLRVEFRADRSSLTRKRGN